MFLLFPFKILAVPGKAILGIVGVIIAAVLNAIIFRQIASWIAWNFGLVGMTAGWLVFIAIASFILTFFAVD